MADVVLVGLPGSGKTTTARALAARLERPFVDTDDVFFERENVTVQEYLRGHDENEFRQRELGALTWALALGGVVATGGGIVATAASRRLLSGQLTVWLDSPDEVLVSRVRDGDRPLLGDDPGARLVELRARRDALYAEVSRCRVDSSGPLEEVLEQIVRIVASVRTSP